jgi:hypothetical protein
MQVGLRIHFVTGGIAGRTGWNAVDPMTYELPLRLLAPHRAGPNTRQHHARASDCVICVGGHDHGRCNEREVPGP